ncbi:hypothetical protein FRC06_004926 [Ceratobasidium sp. 370]|nr:hypothetical protein FRC06_004926 [Ceratobasidium sp. 370]
MAQFVGQPSDGFREHGSGGNEGRNNEDAEPMYPEDDAREVELRYMEETFLSYSQSSLKIDTLKFDIQSLRDSLATGHTLPQGLETLLRYLPPALPSTKQLEYQARGYMNLITSLGSLQCTSKRLNARRIELIAMVSAELDKLLAAASGELETQASIGTHHDGLRRIHSASTNSERYVSPVVFAVVVLISIIHCMMGVARDHCNFILQCLRFILGLVAKMQDSQHAHIFASNHIDPIPATLPTALQYIGLQDDLDSYVVCPACDTLYKEDDTTDIPERCSYVNLDGAVCGAELFALQYRGNHTWKTPLRRFSHQPLESWLSRFLNRPDIEEMLEGTCPLNQEPCYNIWGAEYLSNFPGNGQPSFFQCSSDELRLAFLVYHDFFNPYTNKIAGKQRSIGLIMMVCLNLPPDVRYDMKNIYVTAMLPGPREPTLDNINKYLRPIVDNFSEHYDPGVYISKTHKYPRGRKVRCAPPITSMDVGACRAFAGIGSHSHKCFCSFCTANLSQIDDFNLSHFSVRSMEDRAVHVDDWINAPNLEARQKIWNAYGVRYSEWSRFPWYNPFTDTTIAPLHWIKNVLEKQIRDNMGCTMSAASGIPSAPPPLPRALTTVEIHWGYSAMMHLSEDDFAKSKFPEPLLRYMCRDKGIFEAGLASKRMTADLNQWRLQNNILRENGDPVNPELDHIVATTKAEYYLSRAEKVTAALSSGSTMPALKGLCSKFNLPWKKEDKKADLLERLVKYYPKNVKVVTISEPPRPIGEGPILGMDRVSEIKHDMKQTNLPSWLKKPPTNFATAEHGKLASEEYKSLSLISLPITLIRLRSTVSPETQEYFDHFLHLSVVIRILSYQSLTSHDILLFEYHYQQYVNNLKRLYPFDSVTPVQHLGLHIPYFLRKLGPSTRYSENTCEMFIGMLQEMTTNSRLGM